MGVAMGRVITMGMTVPTKTVCNDIACTQANCIAVVNDSALAIRTCNLTENGGCICNQYNGSLVNVTCEKCVRRADWDL